MNILTLDLETQNHRHLKRLASQFCEENYVVQIGWSVNGGEKHEKYYDAWHRDPILPDLTNIDIINGFNIKYDLLWVWREPEFQAFLKKGGRIYCGQYMEYLLNGMAPDSQMVSMDQVCESYGGGLKNDAVKEMWNDGVLTADIPRDLLTDYLIGDGKEIIGDIENTWLILTGQLARARANHPKEFMTTFWLRMDGLLATCEMEYNGLHVDTELAETHVELLNADLDEALVTLNGFIPPTPEGYTFSWGSPVQKSCLIFGGVVTYKKWAPHLDEHGEVQYAKMDVVWPQFTYNGRKVSIDPTSAKVRKAGEFYVYELSDELIAVKCTHTVHNNKRYMIQDRYKSGKRQGDGITRKVKVPNVEKPKGAIQDHMFKFDGFVKPKSKWKGKNLDAHSNHTYSVSAEVVDELGTMGLPFTDALSMWAKLNKLIGTYYIAEDKNGKQSGMMTLVNEEGIIHHRLNHVKTVTSRLSSSDPNLQNIPRFNKKLSANVKECFSSRFKDGIMGEVDYSQLEVVGQQVLTGDPQMKEDLLNKVDFHCKRLSLKLGEDYLYVWEKCHTEEDEDYKTQRTKAKNFSFQRAYGAGVAAIVADTGMSKQDVEELIANDEAAYPLTVKFDQQLEKTIQQNAVKSESVLFIGGLKCKVRESHWDAPTGTRYTWREGIAPKWLNQKGIYTAFSPTERKNYPVQGVSGEFVQAMLGKVFRYFVANDMFDYQILLCNTVHDCVQTDGTQEATKKVLPNIQKILESVPEVYNKLFPDTMSIEVPFPCEAEVGPNLQDLMKWEHYLEQTQE